jgi:CheY-like chemotaxis protein
MATILYAEDHPPAQLLMRAIVAELTAHTLLTAATAAEARALAATVRPDLYIIDLDLPDGDGLTVIAALQAIHRAPTLLVSAYAEAVKAETLGAHIFAYLPKPLEPADVAAHIERALA